MDANQINRLRKLAGLNEGNEAEYKMWYRGIGESEYNNNRESEQEGPGFYFSSSEEDARTYGPNILRGIFRGKVIPKTKFPKLADQLKWLVLQHPEWEDKMNNWDEDPEVGLRKFVRSAIQYNDLPKDCFLQVWIDVYKYEPKEFAENMAKIWDGFVVSPNPTTDVQHLILYNKAAFEFQAN